MAETMFTYSKFIDSILKGKVNVTSDAFKVMIATNTYTPDQAAHQYKSNVTNEASGTGYTAGGKTCTLNANVALVSTNYVWTIDVSDVEWDPVTLTNARYGIVYDDTPATDATKPLVACLNFGENKNPSAGAFTITWDAAGIITFTVPVGS